MSDNQFYNPDNIVKKLTRIFDECKQMEDGPLSDTVCRECLWQKLEILLEDDTFVEALKTYGLKCKVTEILPNGNDGETFEVAVETKPHARFTLPARIKAVVFEVRENYTNNVIHGKIRVVKGTVQVEVVVPNKNYPEGLAYRSDLPDHLVGPHGFKKNGTLHGTHNQTNAIEALAQKGATYELTPTGTKGISELNYKYFNEAKSKYVTGRKTVYDSNIYSDQQMLDLSQSVGQKAFEMYKSGNIQNFYDISNNGINFRAYINIDPKTNAPFVGNVHPIN